MPTQDLGFNVFALDRASRTFEQMSNRVERMSDKMDELDSKRAEPEVDVDVDRAMGKMRRLADGFGRMVENLVPKSKVHLAAIGAAAAGVFASLPVLAKMASVGIVGALGAGLAGVGLKVAATSEEVKQEFASLKQDVTARMQELAAPLEGVLVNAADQAREAFNEIAPSLGQAFDDMSGPLTRFTNKLGQGLEELEPAIAPITDAFNEILDELGPRLPRIFSNVAAALTILAGVAEENSDLFARMIQFGSRLIGAFAKLIQWASMMGDAIARAFAGMSNAIGAAVNFSIKTVLRLVSLTLGGVSRLLSGVAKIPGPWQSAFQTSAAATEAAKGQVDLLRSSIGKTHPKRVDVTALTHGKGRVDALRSSLAKVPRSIQTTIDVATTGVPAAGALGALGDPRFRQHGGPVQRGRPFVVGESGPELFIPNQNGAVVSNDDAAAGGPVGGAQTLRVQLEVVGSEDDLTKLIRKAVRVQGGGSVQAALGQ